KAAFGEHTERRGFCALGAVKTRVGHAEAASGITSFVSAVLALAKGEIPPNLNLIEPSRQIVVEDSPFYLNERLRPLGRQGTRPRAAVNSFGLGGMSVHMVLEEAPDRAGPPTEREEQTEVLALSARSATALAHLIQAYRDRLRDDDSLRRHDVCVTANCGRTA